jgi:hypothetical protein
MRTVKNFIGDLDSSFMSCEKDSELIIRKLLVENKPYSDELKRLLLINTKDCLDDRTNPAYKEKIAKTSIADMLDQGYIRLKPLLKMKENQESMNYIILSYDNFTPNGNDHYRDCIIEIDIICPLNSWDLGNFRIRPLKIAGYIDGILNKNKLTGIGILNFLSCNEIVLSEELAGYCLMYSAVHGDDDTIPPEDM